MARLAGLQTADEPSLKPGTFLEATAALNPHAAWRGPVPEGPVAVAATEPTAGPPPAGR
jgi:hypothetical protein